ncbi:CsgG/HfaB family protein, partial [Vibrio lentus]
VLLSVTTSKTISSHEIGFGAFRFVDYKELLEVEMGYSHNEPVNIAVMSAIDAAVIHLIVKGMKRGMWSPGDPNAIRHPIIARYLAADTDIL